MTRNGKILVFAAVIIIAAGAVASLALKNQTKTAVDPTAAPAATGAAAEPVDLSKLKYRDTPVPAPATPFTDGTGASHTLADWKGKVLVVNFWATWCAPCVKEMPTLDALQAAMGGDSFAVVAVNQDREGQKVAEPFIAKNEWKNIALYVEPSGRFMKDARLNGLPTSILVDKQGNEVARLEGTMDWNAPEVKAEIRKLVEKP
jgi:thiol-disulfide isomerase/thioredoxin